MKIKLLAFFIFTIFSVSCKMSNRQILGYQFFNFKNMECLDQTSDFPYIECFKNDTICTIILHNSKNEVRTEKYYFQNGFWRNKYEIKEGKNLIRFDNIVHDGKLYQVESMVKGKRIISLLHINELVDKKTWKCNTKKVRSNVDTNFIYHPWNIPADSLKHFSDFETTIEGRYIVNKNMYKKTKEFYKINPIFINSYFILNNESKIFENKIKE